MGVKEFEDHVSIFARSFERFSECEPFTRMIGSQRRILLLDERLYQNDNC